MPTSYTPTSYSDAIAPWVEAANLNKSENALAAMATEKVEKAGDSMTGILSLVGASATAKVLLDEHGEYQEYPTVEPLRWGLASGSAASPITVGKPCVRISRRENISAIEQPNAAGNERNAALQIVSRGEGTSTPQVNGISVVARGGGTTVGADVCGINSVGLVSNSGATGYAMAAYLEGVRSVTTGNCYGIEVNCNNGTAADGIYENNSASDTMGIWVGAKGNSGVDSAAAMVIASSDLTGGSSNNQWKVGIGALTNTIADAFLRDDSSATTSVLIKGAHAASSIGVASGAGPVVIGQEQAMGYPSRNFAAAVLEVWGPNSFTDPLFVYGSLSNTQTYTSILRNAAGILKFGVSGGSGHLLVGTVAGDGVFQTTTSAKSVHMGGQTAKVVSVTYAGELGFFGVTPATKRTGWGAATGTATRTAFDTTTVTLEVLAQHVKAMQDDITSYGLIGA